MIASLPYVFATLLFGGMLLVYGGAVWAAFALPHTEDTAQTLARAKRVQWAGVGLAGMALLVCIIWIWLTGGAP